MTQSYALYAGLCSPRIFRIDSTRTNFKMILTYPASGDGVGVRVKVAQYKSGGEVQSEILRFFNQSIACN